MLAVLDHVQHSVSGSLQPIYTLITMAKALIVSLLVSLVLTDWAAPYSSHGVGIAPASSGTTSTTSLPQTNSLGASSSSASSSADYTSTQAASQITSHPLGSFPDPTVSTTITTAPLTASLSTTSNYLLEPFSASSSITAGSAPGR